MRSRRVLFNSQELGSCKLYGSRCGSESSVSKWIKANNLPLGRLLLYLLLLSMQFHLIYNPLSLFVTMLLSRVGLPLLAGLWNFTHINDIAWAGAFLFEVVADRQKSAWRKAKDAKEHDQKYISSGLWSLSRHPNVRFPQNHSCLFSLSDTRSLM